LAFVKVLSLKKPLFKRRHECGLELYEYFLFCVLCALIVNTVIRHVMIYDGAVFVDECCDAEVFTGECYDAKVFASECCEAEMPRTRAFVFSVRGEEVSEAVVETPTRGRGRAKARGCANGIASARGRACGAAPAIDRGIRDHVGQLPVVPTSVMTNQITRDVILTTTEEQCYERFQKIKSPLSIWHAMTIVPDEAERVRRSLESSRGPILLVSFLVPHLEARVHIEVVAPFSVVGRFIHLCQQLRLVSHPEGFMVRAKVARVAYPIRNNNYLCRDLGLLVGIQGQGKVQLGRGGRTFSRGPTAPHGGGRGSTQIISGRDGQCYAFLGRPEVETSDSMIIGIVPVCHRPTTVLFNLGSTFSYMSTYFAARYDTWVDLIILGIVEFDVILGIDWISPNRAILDCYAKTMTLAMLGVPRVEWMSASGSYPSKVISFIRA
ncbi:hypothetical protein MTR67_031025, partial [Solanum verrucosum]